LATFYGWAINDNAAIASVAITVDGVPYGTAQYGASRPDVCTAYPGRAGCPNVGWSFTLDTTQLADGNHTLGVTAMASGGTSTASVNFTVGNWSAPNPMMVTIENPSPSSGTISGSALFSGWALQNNVPLNLVQVSIDGVPYGPASYGATRADVCTNFPSGGGCPNVGWSFLVDTTLLFNGQHTLAVTGSTYNGYSSTATTKFTVFN
jgi:hypothetical protein